MSSARNGLRHGDVSYLSMSVRDIARTRAFYGPLLGWTFDPADPAPRSSVSGVRPEMGVNGSTSTLGVVVAYRVDDIAAAVQRVRAHGGSATDPVQRPYALEAECVDDQGISLYLHQFADTPGRPEAAAATHGVAQGDVAYISLAVPSLPDAQEFYGAVLGWTYSAGSVAVLEVNGSTPVAGLRGDGGWIGARLAYRVDDLATSLKSVAALGGASGPVDERASGLTCDDCIDDQGAPFMLMQPAR